MQRPSRPPPASVCTAASRLVLLAAALLPGGATAQRTWIVDKRNGPNTSFLSLLDASASLLPNHGDTVLVRGAGVRDPYTGGGGYWIRGVTVLCEPDVFIAEQAHEPFLSVRGLPAGTTFTWKGGGIPLLSYRRVELVDNDGRIVFDAATQGVAPSFHVDDCRMVTINGCTLHGDAAAPALRIVNRSFVTVTGSSVRGFAWTTTTGPAVEVTTSTLYLAQCSVVGGGYVPSFASGPSRPAIVFSSVLAAEGVRVCGDPTAAIVAAGDPPPQQPRANAIELTRGFLARDPAVPIIGAIARNLGAQEYVQPFTAQTVRGAAPGQVLETRAYLRPACAMTTLFGLPASPAFVGLDTNLFLAAPAVLASGVADLGGVFALQVPVPDAPVLHGLALAFQTVGVLSSGYALSNPAIALLH